MCLVLNYIFMQGISMEPSPGSIKNVQIKLSQSSDNFRFAITLQNMVYEGIKIDFTSRELSYLGR